MGKKKAAPKLDFDPFEEIGETGLRPLGELLAEEADEMHPVNIYLLGFRRRDLLDLRATVARYLNSRGLTEHQRRQIAADPTEARRVLGWIWRPASAREWRKAEAETNRRSMPRSQVGRWNRDWIAALLVGCIDEALGINAMHNLPEMMSADQRVAELRRILLGDPEAVFRTSNLMRDNQPKSRRSFSERKRGEDEEIITSATMVVAEEMARRCGMSVYWLREQANAGRIPMHRAGRKMLFDPEKTIVAIKTLATQSKRRKDGRQDRRSWEHRRRRAKNNTRNSGAIEANRGEDAAPPGPASVQVVSTLAGRRT